METQENAPALSLSYKCLEILFIVSVTVNFCVSWSVILPKLCHAILRGLCHRRRDDQLSEEYWSEIPFFCRRFSTNLIFTLTMPVCGIILLINTDLLHSPFFAYNGSFCLVFSVALGHYVFKTAEVLTFKSAIFHYKPLLVHHVVAMATYISILIYEQNAIMGLVMLFVEGSLVFAEHEQEHFRRVISLREESKLRKIGTAVAFVLALILKGVIPVSLIIIAFLTSISDLLKMAYVPLAFFFLSLVFFAAVDLWFFRDALAELSRQFARFPRLPMIIVPVPRKSSKASPPTTAINNEGLKKLLLARDGLAGSINITENALWEKDLNLSQEAPAILQLESTTPTEIKGQLVVDMDINEK